MKLGAVSDTVDLWEAWIDMQDTPGSYMLYVVGDICLAHHKKAPVLLKKSVQGAAASHLILEVMPGMDAQQGRLTEIGYAEHIADIHQYQQISICAGEEIIACIPDIELVY